MTDSKNVKSVMFVDEKSNNIYGLIINREAAKWNYGKISYSYFQCNFEEFVKIFGSPRELDSRSNALHNTFPIALRAILEDGSYIFEKPPFQYTVHMSPKNARNTSFSENKRYISETVWIPWSFYKLTPIHTSMPQQIPYSFSMFFSDQKITSHDHNFVVAPLPNVFNDGKVCLGDSAVHLHKQYSQLDDPNSIKDIFNIYVNTFYSGGWNTDVLSYIPTMFNYDTFSLQPSHPEYDRLKDLYHNARHSVTPISHRDFSVRNYINSLKIWSQMSLEDTLTCFKTQIDYANNYSVYHSFDRIIDHSEQNYFDYFIAAAGKIPDSPSSFNLQTYWENPVDNSVIYIDNEPEESRYYEILNSLVDFYKEKLSLASSYKF